MLNVNDIQTFLWRVLPWAPLGDPTSYVNLHWTFKSEQYAKPGWGGRAAVSIDEIVKQIQWAAQQPNTLDFYACMSTQRACVEKQAKNGRTIRQAFREQKNAVELRAFWADIDVKADDAHKGATYTTTAEAGAAMMEWLKVSGVPVPTIIVETGSGGLHLYWTLSEALTPEEWQPIANALAEAMRRHGFKADTGLTVDSARVMRIPGTLHSKSKQLARIRKQFDFDYTAEQMRNALVTYYGAKVIELKPKNKIAANDELSGGIEPVSRPINLQTVAMAGCGFIGEALRTGGATYDQPLWNLTTLCATFSDNPQEDAHAMSRGHPEYNEATTQELFERKLREREERDLGWPTCDAIANNGCASCATCPLRKPGSKPLQFGAAAPRQITPTGNVSAPVTTGDELPDGYVRAGPKNTIHKVTLDAKGNPRMVEVFPHPLSNGWVQKHPYAIYFDSTIDWTKKARTFSATHRDTASAEKFSGWCGQNGLFMPSEQRKLFLDFLMSYATLIQQIVNRAVEVKPFGWQKEDGKLTGFAYGGTLYMPNGEKRSTSQPSAALIDQYTPQGELRPWLTAAKIVTSLKTPDREALLAGAFAGPLVYFTNKRGLMISSYSSDSGSFKTTTLEIAQAVWAAPGVKFGVSDTNNNTLNRIGQLNSLPVFWDEIKSKEQAEKYVALTFEVTKGREKGRMASDTSLRFSGEWDTAVISATNDSLVDPIKRQTKSTTAGLHRLFEWEIPKVPKNLPEAIVEQAKLRLRSNYGRAGEIYAEFLGSNIERVERDVSNLTTHYEKLLGTQSDERFWLSSVVTLMLGAQYAVELQLVNFDLQRLEAFLIQTFKKMRFLVVGSDVDLTNPEALATILARFMDHVKPRHFLETERMYMGGRGRAPANASGSIYTDMAKVDVVWCHWARDSNIMRASSTVMREYLRRENHSTHNVIEAFHKQFGMKEVRGILGAGTPLATKFQEVLFEFDLTDPQLRKVIEVVT